MISTVGDLMIWAKALATNFTTRTTGVFVDIAKVLYPDLFPAS